MNRRYIFYSSALTILFLFWYSGIFGYFSLLNDIYEANKRLKFLDNQIKSLENFDLNSYLDGLISLLEDSQTVANFFKIESLIFKSELFAPCPKNDYFCLKLNLANNIIKCNQDFDCLSENLEKQYRQKVLTIIREKEDLESRLRTLNVRRNGLDYSFNPFLLLGKVFNPQLVNIHLSSLDITSQIANLSSEKLLFDQDNQLTEESTTSSIKYSEKIYYSTNKKIIKNSKIQDRDQKIVATSIIPLDKINTKTISFNTISTITTITPVTSTITSTERKNTTESKVTKGGGGGARREKDICEDAKSKNWPNLIVSEIKHESEDSKDDEYVEIYNSTNQEVDLSCWSLEKYASRSSYDSQPRLTILIPQSKFSGKIKPKHFFLITSSSTKNKYNPDLTYPESYSLAENNVIILRKPNGDISDLVGYGDDRNKIYTFEGEPFIYSQLNNRTIQRKNFIDSNDNAKDFWLRSPTPQNSSNLSIPRDDFIDLSGVRIDEFKVLSSTSTDDEKFYLNINFNEPKISISPLNYFFELKIGTNSQIFNLSLSDFGVTTSLPKPMLSGNSVSFGGEMLYCPSQFSQYYFRLLLRDQLDEENISLPATSSVTFPEEFCSFHSPTSSASVTKILISEVRIIEGIKNNYGEYIELYNPNQFEVNLNNWSLRKITKNGDFQKTPIVSSQRLRGIVIKPFSYLLLANNEYLPESNLRVDVIYPSSSSYGLTHDNGLAIIDENNEVIDKICWGKVVGYNDCLVNPQNDRVFLRKAGKYSDEESMKGTEQNYGNSFDSEIVRNNFIVSEPEPQNSSHQEIPPDYFTKEELSVQDNIIEIVFISPYQKLINASYEIRVDNLDDNRLELESIPPVAPYGEREKIMFDGCQNNLKDNQKIFFVLKENNQLKYYREFTLSNLNCVSSTSHKIINYLSSYSNNFKYRLRSIFNNLSFLK
ncbi:MAG: lamin tail domain-containing protein [Patescibacteria group bacterium]|nr:lamin tail domain-containing protein [Patescibacteria group bacterium]